MKKLMSVLVFPLILLFLFTACSSSSPDSSTNAATKTTTTEGTTASSGSSSGPVVVTIANADAVNTLDTVNGFSMVFNRLLPLWADTLEESDRTGNFKPSVATKLETSADGLSVVATIKEGIKFQDGSDLTPEDVAFSYQRILDYKDNLLNPKLWVKYLKSAVVGTEPNTVVFTFNQPMPNFEAEQVTVPIISKKHYEASTDKENYFGSGCPMGSGPYKVTSFNTTDCIITFEKWEDSWNWTKGTSNVDKIIYKSIKESTTRASSLQTGEIDISENVTLDSIEALEKAGCKVYKTLYYQNDFLVFSQKIPLLTNPKIRQAISEAIDRQALVDTVVGGGEAAKWPIMKGLEGYKDNPDGYPYNPDNAKALLTEAGYNGEEIQMNICSTFVPRAAEVAQAIQAMLSEVGFNLKINIMDQAAWQSATFAGQYEINYNTFTYNAGDPIKLYTEVLFGGVDVFQNGYRKPELDEAFTKASFTVDNAAREDLWHKALQMVMDDYAPVIMLFNEEFADAVAPNITGFELYPDSCYDVRFLTKN